MARVILNPDLPIQSLSGTLGNLTFRTVNGKTFVRMNTAAVPLSGTSPQKHRQQFRKMIVENCTREIQSRIEDLPKALMARKRIRDRVVILYNRLAPDIRSMTKLTRAILEEYDRRYKSD